MGKNRLSIFFMLLLPVLFLGWPWELRALESAEEANETNSGNALNRLIWISEQLSTLNGKLRTELQSSKQNSRQLQIMLEASKQELDGLRDELGILRRELELSLSISTELSTKAENSRLESITLQTALNKAASSLTSLELSFAAYRDRAESVINSLEKKNRRWKWGCIAAGVLAAGLGGTLLAVR